MEISLEQPDEVFVVSPDPRLKGVYFGTPEKLSDSENECENENKLKKESVKNIIMDITDLMEIKEVTYTNIKDTHEESNIDLSNTNQQKDTCQGDNSNKLKEKTNDIDSSYNNNQQKDSCDNDVNNKLKEKTRDKNSKDSESKEGARKDQSKIHKNQVKTTVKQRKKVGSPNMKLKQRRTKVTKIRKRTK